MNITALLSLMIMCGLLMIVGMIMSYRDKCTFLVLCFGVGVVISVYNSIELYGMISN